jgi:hypothetical protein
MKGCLRLFARDQEDLGVIAACLQDARIPIREMCFCATDGRFMGAFVRFQRERLSDPTACEGLTQSRAALVFHHVTAAQHRGLDELDDEAELELLTITADAPVGGPSEVTLLFAGGAAIRLHVEAIDCRLEDFGESWPSTVTPCDHFALAEAPGAGH